MNGVTLNFDATNVPMRESLEAIPSGWQNVVIETSEMKDTSKKDGQYLELSMKILDGQYAGRKLFDRLNLVNPNPTAVEIAYKTLSSIAHATGVLRAENSMQYHNIPIKVKVKMRAGRTVVNADTGESKEFDASNEIGEYDNINSNHATGGTGPAAIAAAGGAAPPWAAVGGAAPAAPVVAAPAAPAYTPPVPAFTPPTAAQPWATAAAPAAFVPPAAAPAPPAPPVAAPPVPMPPVQAPPAGPVMLAAATASYEAYKAQGWTDDLLVSRGLMAAPAAATFAPPPPSTAPVPAAPPVAAAAGGIPPWNR